MTSKKQKIFLVEPVAVSDAGFIQLKAGLLDELNGTYAVQQIKNLPFDFNLIEGELTCVLYLFDSDSTEISKMMANFTEIALRPTKARCCVALACVSRDHYKSLTVLDHLMHEFNERGWMVHPHHTIIDVQAIQGLKGREAYLERLRLFFQSIPSVRKNTLQPSASPGAG